MRKELGYAVLSAAAVFTGVADSACSALTPPAVVPAATQTEQPKPTPFEVFILEPTPEDIPYNDWKIEPTNQGFAFKHPYLEIKKYPGKRKITATDPDISLTFEVTSEKLTESEAEYAKRVSDEFGNDPSIPPELRFERKIGKVIGSFERFNQQTKNLDILYLYARNNMIYQISISADKNRFPKTMLQHMLDSANFY